MHINWSNKAVQWGILAFLGMVWGTSYILMKRGLEAFTYTQVAALRLSIAFLVITPVAFRLRKRIRKDNLLSLMIAGYAGIGIPAFLFTLAQTRVSSSLAGVLNSLSPLFTLLIGVLFYKGRARWISIAGVLIGLIGAASLIIRHKGLVIQDINGYALLIGLATILYGLNNNELKANLGEFNGLEVTALALLFVGPPAMIYLYFTGFSPVHATHVQLMGIFYVTILAVFGSVIALILYNHLLKYITAVSASSVTYISPAFAVLWGRSDGEHFGGAESISLILILIGVYLVNNKKLNEQKT